MMEALTAILALTVAVSAAWWTGQLRAAKKTEERLRHEYEAEMARRVEAGREAVGHGRAGGAGPDERLRSNDADW